MPSVYHPRPKADATCPCGNTFKTNASHSKFCSRACRDAARPRVPCRQCGAPTGYFVTSPPAAPPVCRVCTRANAPVKPAVESWECVLCGEQASRPRTRGQRPKYCSPECRVTASWRRRSDDPFVIAPRVRLAIYERDGWTCQLCRGPVAGDLDYLDKWAPTLDHIVARSTGGSDDPANLQLAHRSCNASKSDTPLEVWLERKQLALTT